jgi:histidine ammonia-lyase
MGTIASRKFEKIVRNVRNILSMELLSATQALDLIRPLKPAAGVLSAYKKIREFVPFAEEDRVFSKDVMTIEDLIKNSSILKCVEDAIGELEC